MPRTDRTSRTRSNGGTKGTVLRFQLYWDWKHGFRIGKLRRRLALRMERAKVRGCCWRLFEVWSDRWRERELKREID